MQMEAKDVLVKSFSFHHGVYLNYLGFLNHPPII